MSCVSCHRHHRGPERRRATEIVPELVGHRNGIITTPEHSWSWKIVAQVSCQFPKEPLASLRHTRQGVQVRLTFCHYGLPDSLVSMEYMTLRRRCLPALKGTLQPTSAERMRSRILIKPLLLLLGGFRSRCRHRGGYTVPAAALVVGRVIVRQRHGPVRLYRQETVEGIGCWRLFLRWSLSMQWRRGSAFGRIRVGRSFVGGSFRRLAAV